jgi:hypothetical protein
MLVSSSDYANKSGVENYFRLTVGLPAEGGSAEVGR